MTAFINQLQENDFNDCMLELEENGMLDHDDFQQKSKFIASLADFGDEMLQEMMDIMK
jgi:hypothetical protein